MSNFEIIEQRISLVRKYLDSLEAYKGYTREQIESDTMIRASLERILYLAVQASIDLAEEVIAFKKLRKPASYSEAFDIIAGANFISRDLTERMIKMTGFRNVIAHDYVELDYDKVYDVLHNRLSDIAEFLGIAENLPLT